MLNQTPSQDSVSDPENTHTWRTRKIATFDHLAFGDYDDYEQSYKEAAKSDAYLFGDYDGYQAYLDYGDIPD